MRKTWPQKKLAEVILDIKDGGTPSRKNPEYFGGDIYWCVVKDIKPLIFDTAEKLTQAGLDNSSAKVWPVDSVIISLGATIGQIGIAKVPTATKQGLAGIVLNKQIMTPEFLAYGLLGQKEYIQSLATGATIKEIRPSRFAETIRLPVPPLAEQQRIVSILDEAFAGLASAQAHAARNLQNARALFESHLQAVFAQRGEGWVERSLFEVCELFFDSAHRTPKYQNDGLPALRPRDVVNGILNLTGALRVSEVEYEIQSRRYKLCPGDIVYSRELSYGWAAVLPESPRICLSQGMCVFRSSDKVRTSFLIYLRGYWVSCGLALGDPCRH